MRILVAYVTRSGYTRVVANAIASRLRAHGHAVDVADLEVTIRRPKDYDAVVIGSAVRFGTHCAVVASWIAEHHGDLTRRPCAFFSVDHRAFERQRPDPEGSMERLFERLDWHPRRAAAFAGKRDHRSHAWPRRIVMKAKSCPRGTPTDASHDQILTDWDRVRKFADQVAGDVPIQTEAPRSDRAAPPSAPGRSQTRSRRAH